MRHFTPEEDQFLRDNYLTMPVKTMAKVLGRADVVPRQRMKILGLIVPAEIIAQRKLQSRFQQGSVPPNKGRKQVEYMTAEAIERTAASRYKKGNLPPNTMHDHAISIRNDSSGTPYKFIRISKAVWIPLHRYNWIQANGPIAPKMKLIFKDRNTMNCELENLELLTPGELMERNSFHRYPKEIAQVIQLRGALNRQINKHTKRLENEKQD